MVCIEKMDDTTVLSVTQCFAEIPVLRPKMIIFAAQMCLPIACCKTVTHQDT